LQTLDSNNLHIKRFFREISIFIIRYHSCFISE